MNNRSKYVPKLRRSTLATLVMALVLCGCYNTLSSDGVPSSKSEAQRMGSAESSPAPPQYSGARNAVQTERLMDSAMAVAQAEVTQTASLFPLPALPVAALSVAEAAAPVQPYLVKTMEIYLQHLEKPPIRPSELWPEIPRPLEQLILKCLEKRPTARYASAGELLNALGGLRG